MFEAYLKKGHNHRTKIYIVKNMGSGFYKCLVPSPFNNKLRKRDIYQNQLTDKNGKPLTDQFLSKIRKVWWEND